MTAQASKVNAINSVKVIRSNNIKPILSDDIKRKINYGFNGTAAAINAAATLSGNFMSGNSFQESLESLSSLSMRFATIAQGGVEATIAYEKKNLISFIGAVLELPAGIFAPWYNFFFHRGTAIGSNLYEGVIGNMTVEENEEKVRYEDFAETGWLKGGLIMTKQAPKLLKEIFTKPFEKDGLFSRWSFFFSSGMILGPLVNYVGLPFGHTIRAFSGGAEAVALTLHTNKTDTPTNNNSNTQKHESNKKKLSMFSNYFWSGVVWTAGAATDYLKRIPSLGDAINNWTEFSLSLDRLGSIFYILGNQGTDKAST